MTVHLLNITCAIGEFVRLNWYSVHKVHTDNVGASVVIKFKQKGQLMVHTYSAWCHITQSTRHAMAII